MKNFINKLSIQTFVLQAPVETTTAVSFLKKSNKKQFISHFEIIQVNIKMKKDPC